MDGPTTTCGRCLHGWICEQHPDQPWPHPSTTEPDGVCAGPGMPCRNPDCPAFAELEARLGRQLPRV